jgi:hypothetical protein
MPVSLDTNITNLNFTAQPVVMPTPTPLPSPSPGTLLTQPPGTLNQQITAVAQPDGQFTVLRPANTTGFNGFVTDRPFDFTGGRISVGVAQAAPGGADTDFAIGTDNTNFFRFVIRSQASAIVNGAQDNYTETALNTTTAQLIFQVRQDNGELRSYPTPPINYDPALHRFLRFRHDRSTSYPGQPDSALGYIAFDASGCPASGSCPPNDPDSLPWRELFRIPLLKTVAAMDAELSSGTTTPAVPPGTAVFDNFRPFNPNTPTQPPLGIYALLLNGTNAYFEVPTISGLNITGPLTVEAWFKTNLANRQQSLVERYNTDATNQNLSDGGYALRIGPTGKLQFYTLKNGLVFDMVEGGTTITLGQWHHAAGVFDGSQLRVYLDGAQDGMKSSTFAPAAGTASLKIGAQGDTPINKLNGAITVVRISAGALYTGHFTPSQLLTAGPNTAGLWRFDAQSLSDFSGNGNTGVLRGSAAFANAGTTIQFTPADYQVGEGDGRLALTVTRSGDLSSIASVDYRTVDTDTFTVNCADTHGAAFGRCDFATAVGTLTFAAGDPQPKTITVPVINDVCVEGNETFQVKLSNPVGATLGAPDTATVTVIDNDTNLNAPNPVYSATNPNGPSPFFVRLQYLDFLSREPETGGFNAWLNVLNQCADVNNVNSPPDPSAGCDRIQVSTSFFGSQEFQLKGLFVFRFYKVAFGRRPQYVEIVRDMSFVAGSTAEEVYQRKVQLAVGFTQRTEFSALLAKSHLEYVTTLFDRYGLTQITTPDPANPDGTTKITLTSADLVSRLNANTITKAQVLRAVADSDQVNELELSRAFVAMQYYGYLRRNPDDAGYNAWLNYLNTHPGDVRTMVNGFMNSPEYRLRFGNPNR